MSLLSELAKRPSDAVAISYAKQSYSYAQLRDNVAQFSAWLIKNEIRSLCICIPNSYEWVIADLACQDCNVLSIPAPVFFSQQQIQHLLDETQPDCILQASLEGAESIDIAPELTIYARRLYNANTASFPDATSKVTFTSGSTGQAKGVCLSVNNQLKVAKSLVQAIGIEYPKHLVLLPLATLLENIAGIYAPLLAKGQIQLPSDSEKGFEGSRLVDVPALLRCISTYQPNSIIIVPELLLVLVMASQNGWTAPKSLKFIAVGGAKVDQALIVKARKLGLPVQQGYGLSECASVVSLCMDESDEQSVGKILGHSKAKIINEEIVVSGNCFLGYVGQPDSWYPQEVYTGDLGQIHEQHVYITGRKKNLIINSFGRNVSPEWIESKLIASGIFAQMMVCGEAKPYLCALLYPINSQVTLHQINKCINAINQDLPDYAKIEKHIVVGQAFSHQNGQLTENGKLKRDVIQRVYHNQIEAQYLQSASFA